MRIPRSAFSDISVKALSVAGNPFLCDCETLWLRNLLSRYGHYCILSIFILLWQQIMFPISVRSSIEYVRSWAKMYVQSRTLKLVQRYQGKISLIEKKVRENY